MDIDYVKQMCCNLQQQQQKINETYDELMNSLNLQDKVDDLNRKLDKKEEELVAKDNLIKEYENKLNLKDSEVEKYNNLIENKEMELKEAKRQLNDSLEDLERVKSAGNMIISAHNQQFVKLLGNMEKLSDFIEYYTAEGPNNNDSDGTNRDDPKPALEQNSTSKSSLELLVDINNKFVKISVNIMKLLSQFDHDILNSYINCDDLAANFELLGKLGSAGELSSGLREPIYGSNGRTSSIDGTNYMGSAHVGAKLVNNSNNFANSDPFRSNHKYPPTPSNSECQPSSSQQTPNRARPATWEYSIIPTYPIMNPNGNNAGKMLNSQADNSGLHLPTNSNVKRIVTRFRPNFNASFQQIPLGSSVGGLSGYNAVFKPLYASSSKSKPAHVHSRSATSSVDAGPFRSATSYSDGPFGRTDSLLSGAKGGYGLSTIDSSVFVDLPQEAPKAEHNGRKDPNAEPDQINPDQSKESGLSQDPDPLNGLEAPLRVARLWDEGAPAPNVVPA